MKLGTFTKLPKKEQAIQIHIEATAQMRYQKRKEERKASKGA